MPHDTRMTTKRDLPSRNLNFRCPYQARVIKTLEAVSRRIVFMRRNGGRAVVEALIRDFERARRVGGEAVAVASRTYKR
jgi:hypothetical protein